MGQRTAAAVGEPGVGEAAAGRDRRASTGGLVVGPFAVLIVAIRVSPTSARRMGPSTPSHLGCGFGVVKLASVYSR
jgi:hypothetical protein